jgi:hypothetical protein
MHTLGWQRLQASCGASYQMGKYEMKSSEFDWSRFERIAQLASSWKAQILKRGLRKAKAPCPFCKGMWHGQLNGPKNHLHLACDGDCGTMLMQ